MGVGYTGLAMLALVCLLVIAVLGTCYRQLLFATVDPDVVAARVVASPAVAVAASVAFAEVAAVGGILLSLAPGVPVSVFVATISFVIYLFCWLVGRRREVAT
ncbi:hypothetical protein AWC11_05780 [Mycobacterium interjectum]|nr:hypothetical protein AWC11_05780 [Mycobacterium interjectum]